MTALAPLTAGRFVSVWRFDPWAAAAVLLLLAAYLAGLRLAGRRGSPWPAWRTAGFIGIGLGVIVVATMSSLSVYSAVLMWPAALQVTLLLAIVPVGLGLGDPLALIAASLAPAHRERWRSVLRSPVVRVLTFPAVAPVLAVATQFLVFYTGYLGAAQRHGWVENLLELQLVVTGALFALPLLGVEVLPSWCTQPVRMAFAAFDGLLDAVPGIAVMTSGSLLAGGYYGTVTRSWGPTRSWDQTIAGGLMLTVAEVVAVPFIAILFRAWIHEDASRARDVDQQLDREQASRAVAHPGGDGAADRPWWEVDPGPLADRAGRYGWTERTDD